MVYPYSLLFFVAWCFILLANCGEASAVLEKLDDIEAQVEENGAKLDLLLGLTTRRPTDTTARTLPSIPPTPQVSGSQSSLVNTGPIQLVSVERVRVDSQQNLFTARYRSSTDVEDMIHYFYESDAEGNSFCRDIDTVTVESDGEVVVTFTSRTGSISRSTDVYFILMDKQMDYVLDVTLNNTISPASHPNVHHLSELPELQVDPIGDVPYQEGEDVVVEFSFDSQILDSSAMRDPYLSQHFFGVDLDVQPLRFERGFYREEFLSATYRRNPRTNIEDQASVSINTSRYHVSGFLQVRFEVTCPWDSLVKEMRTYQTLKIRPADQPGLFPYGFLKFTDDNTQHQNENGTDQFSCTVNTECQASCQVFGDNVSGIDVYRIFDDGSRVMLRDTVKPFSGVTNHQAIYWMVHPESEGTTTYSCMAFDTKSMSVARRTVEVVGVSQEQH